MIRKGIGFVISLAWDYVRAAILRFVLFYGTITIIAGVALVMLAKYTGVI